MTKLSVNINKIATLRNTRHLGIPSVTRAAVVCLDAGADGITIHPRPDERHIRADDVTVLAELLRKYPAAEFNIEGNPFEGKYLEHIEHVRPTQCTLVPDALDAFTSNQGWNLDRDAGRLEAIIKQLKAWGCRVSLFMDPLPAAMAMAKRIGADRVELYTEPYAAGYASGRGDEAAGQPHSLSPSPGNPGEGGVGAFSARTNPHPTLPRRTGRGLQNRRPENAVALDEAVKPYVEAASAARSAGLGVNAGHDLNLHNLPAFLQAVEAVDEVSIGHALIADALELGLKEATRQYLAVCMA